MYSSTKYSPLTWDPQHSTWKFALKTKYLYSETFMSPTQNVKNVNLPASPGHVGPQQQRQQQDRWRLCGADQGSAPWCTVGKGTRLQERQGSTLPPSGHLWKSRNATTRKGTQTTSYIQTSLCSTLSKVIVFPYEGQSNISVYLSSYETRTCISKVYMRKKQNHSIDKKQNELLHAQIPKWSCDPSSLWFRTQQYN